MATYEKLYDPAASDLYPDPDGVARGYVEMTWSNPYTPGGEAIAATDAVTGAASILAVIPSSHSADASLIPVWDRANSKMKAGVIPEEVCEACNDISLRTGLATPSA